MDAMLESFIAESRDNLETAGDCFLKLEKTPTDEDLLNDLFRSMHTMKGSSGLFDIPELTKVVHAAEDVLDSIRSGELAITSEYVDLFLDTMDQLSAWLDDLTSTGQLGADAQSISQSLTHNLRSLLGESSATSVADTSVNTSDNTKQSSDIEQSNDTNTPEPPGWLKQIPDNLRLNLFKRVNKEKVDILAVEYTPDSECFFSGEDPLHTIRNLPGLVGFCIHTKESWPEPAAMDPYQCNLIFYALVAGDESDICHYLRYIFEHIQLTQLQPLQLVLPTGKLGDHEPFDGFVTEAPQVWAKQDWQQLQRLVTPLLEISGPELLQTSVLRWINALLQQFDPNPELLNALLDTVVKGEFHWPLISNTPTTDKDTSETVETTEPTRSQMQLSEQQLKLAANALAVQKQILSMPCSQELLTGRIASVATVIKNLLDATQTPTDNLVQAVENAQNQNSPAPLVNFITDLKPDSQLVVEEKNDPAQATKTESVTQAQTQKQHKTELRQGERRRGDRRQENGHSTELSSPQNKTIKVDQRRIDALMDLVGELVVAKNALPFIAKRAEDDFGIRALSKEISSQYAVINRLAEELQSAMMQIRMVPVSTVFQRFPRLVRDLSRKLNKQIKLVLQGEDTEADKNVVENLADPLIHLVRNSLDHGLETAQQREAAGKPTQGTITLRAIPHDDQVVIEVVDDGRGIDPEVIKRKAYEKGIIDEQQLDSICDLEALQLILAPGFSTAEEISDLSGRGVGMDVVHSAVSQAGGSVVINSIKGEGTTVRLSLPLSMAVSRVMMIEVDGQNYGISMEDIVETVRLPANAVQRIKHSEVVVLRDRLIPLFQLRQLLGLEPVTISIEEIAVLVMILNGEEVGLMIDEFHEGIDIIQKPLDGIMACYPYYSGAALLGNGRVLLILNVMELLACR